MVPQFPRNLSNNFPDNQYNSFENKNNINKINNT